MNINYIIPFHNEEKLIERCLESILESYKNKDNYRIIFVNDNSEDNTLNVILDYIKDKNIDSHTAYIFNNKGKGTQDARIEGLKQLSIILNGNYFDEYVAYIDADDYIDKTFVPEIENIINTYCSVDTIMYNYYYDTAYEQIPNRSFDDFEDDIYYLGNNVLKMNNMNWRFSMLCVVVKFSVLYNLIDDISVHYSVGEDTCTTYILYSKSSVMYLNKCIYHYCQNSNSCMHTYNESKFTDRIESVRYVLKYITNHNIEISERCIDLLLDAIKSEYKRLQ